MFPNSVRNLHSNFRKTEQRIDLGCYDSGDYDPQKYDGFVPHPENREFVGKVLTSSHDIGSYFFDEAENVEASLGKYTFKIDSSTEAVVSFSA